MPLARKAFEFIVSGSLTPHIYTWHLRNKMSKLKWLLLLSVPDQCVAGRVLNNRSSPEFCPGTLEGAIHIFSVRFLRTLASRVLL